MQIKPLCNTPYADVGAQAPQVGPQAPQDPQASQNVGDGSQSSDELCATLADWLNSSLPSSQELDVSFVGATYVGC